MAAPAAVAAFVTAAASTYSAVEQNKAAKKTAKARQQAADLQIKQLNEAAGLEKEKRTQEARRLSARMRVAQGESGVSLGFGTPAALQRQVDFDLNRNLGILDQNLLNQTQLVQSGAAADLAALEAQQVNPLIAGFGGGVQGFDTGLSIGNAIQSSRSNASQSTSTD